MISWVVSACLGLKIQRDQKRIMMCASYLNQGQFTGTGLIISGGVLDIDTEYRCYGCGHRLMVISHDDPDQNAFMGIDPETWANVRLIKHLSKNDGCLVQISRAVTLANALYEYVNSIQLSIATFEWDNPNFCRVTVKVNNSRRDPEVGITHEFAFSGETNGKSGAAILDHPITFGSFDELSRAGEFSYHGILEDKVKRMVMDHPEAKIMMAHSM